MTVVKEEASVRSAPESADGVAEEVRRAATQSDIEKTTIFIAKTIHKWPADEKLSLVAAVLDDVKGFDVGEAGLRAIDNIRAATSRILKQQDYGKGA